MKGLPLLRTTATCERVLHVTEVAPRDGLQSQSMAVPTGQKVRLIKQLADAGLTRIEVGAFVSSKAVPQMADSAEVVAAARRLGGLHLSAFVPNMRGLERAQASGVDAIAVALSATETMNMRNIGMSLDKAKRSCFDTVREARTAHLPARAYLAVAFECPFEGPVRQDTVLRLAHLMTEAGASEIVIADTIGAAAPAQVQALLQILLREFDADRLAIHLHDTRGLAIANAWAALQCGIRRFDSSAAGIGGCPFAPGAAGNLATEDLVLLAHQCGFGTGVDLARLGQAIGFAEELLCRPLGGRSMAWQRRTAPWTSSQSPQLPLQNRATACP
jgi:hydroxymethylglutaryl-CoA lyase